MNCAGLPLRVRQRIIAQDTGGDDELIFKAGTSPEEFFNPLPVPDLPSYQGISSSEMNLCVMPYMYSYSGELFSNKSTIKVANSIWPKVVSFETVGMSGEVTIGCEDSNHLYSLGISVQSGPDRFGKMKITIITP